MYYWRNNTLSIQKKQKTHNKYHVIKLSYRLKQSILVFGDIACFYAAFFVSLIIRHGAIPTTNKIDEQTLDYLVTSEKMRALNFVY